MKKGKETREERVARLTAEVASGKSRTEVAAAEGIGTQRLRRLIGAKDPIENPEGRPFRGIYVHPKPFLEAAGIAKELGFVCEGGTRTGEGHVGKFIEAIANGDLAIVVVGSGLPVDV